MENEDSPFRGVVVIGSGGAHELGMMRAMIAHCEVVMVDAATVGRESMSGAVLVDSDARAVGLLSGWLDEAAESPRNLILVNRDEFKRFVGAGFGAGNFEVMDRLPVLETPALKLPPDARHGKSAGQLRREVYGREKNGRNLPRGRR
jgi:hypothetical protein